MNFERYIAARINKPGGPSFTRLIVHIAIATIALSMIVMIISTNVITGFKNQIKGKVFDFWGHIHISSNMAGESFELIPIYNDPAVFDTIMSIKDLTYARPASYDIDDQELQYETSEGGVKDIEPFIVVPSILVRKKEYEGLLLKGVDKSYDQERINTFLKQGTFISFADNVASRDLVISESTAQRMNYSVGQKVNIYFIIDGRETKKQFKISGIYKTGLDEYDRRFGLIDIRFLQDLLGWEESQISGLEVFIDNLDDLDILNDYIHFELLPPAISGESVESRFHVIFEWLELQNINEMVINILMLLVALINMATALLIFVLERSSMIGVLKALGATNWTIRKIFLYNAGSIILKGVLIGNVVAISLCFFQKYTGLLKLDEANYYLSVVPIEFNIPSMLLINVLTIVIVLIFLLLPSIIVAKISPVKTIQYK